MLTYSDIIEDAITNDGGTYDLGLFGRADLPERGYMVGVKKIAVIDMDRPRMAQHKVLREYLLKARADDSAVADRFRFIGLWIDSGHCHVDIVELYFDRSRAMQAARENNELAIWDIAAGESLLTEGNEAPVMFHEYNSPQEQVNHLRLVGEGYLEDDSDSGTGQDFIDAATTIERLASQDVRKVVQVSDSQTVEYELRIETDNDGSVNYDRAKALDLKPAYPIQFGVYQHNVGDCFEWLADFDSIEPARALIALLEKLTAN